jgi:hypothetical protein
MENAACPARTKQPAEWEKVGDKMADEKTLTVAPSSFLILNISGTNARFVYSSFFRSFSIEVHLNDIVFNIHLSIW